MLVWLSHLAWLQSEINFCVGEVRLGMKTSQFPYELTCSAMLPPLWISAFLCVSCGFSLLFLYNQLLNLYKQTGLCVGSSKDERILELSGKFIALESNIRPFTPNLDTVYIIHNRSELSCKKYLWIFYSICYCHYYYFPWFNCIDIGIPPSFLISMPTSYKLNILLFNCIIAL